MIKFLIAKYYNYINQLFAYNVEEVDIENPNNFLIGNNNQNDCIKWLYVDTII